MSAERYDLLPPEVGESNRNDCLRLQEMGHEEMFIRKTLAHHFHVKPSDFSPLFNELEEARLRHLTMLRLLVPHHNHSSMVKKVAKNLDISDELAERWVTRHEDIGDVPFLSDETMQSR